MEEKTYIATPDLDIQKEKDIAFIVECKIKEAEIKTFLGKQKLRKFITRSALQELLDGVLQNE